MTPLHTLDFRAAVRSALADRSVYWLAKESGVPQPSLHEWLAGKSEGINSRSLERVAAALSLSLTTAKPAKRRQKNS